MLQQRIEEMSAFLSSSPTEPKAEDLWHHYFTRTPVMTFDGEIVSGLLMRRSTGNEFEYREATELEVADYWEEATNPW